MKYLNYPSLTPCLSDVRILNDSIQKSKRYDPGLYHDLAIAVLSGMTTDHLTQETLKELGEHIPGFRRDFSTFLNNTQAETQGQIEQGSISKTQVLDFIKEEFAS